jgi:LysM repeat protein
VARRSLPIFLLLNVLVTVGVVFLLNQFLNRSTLEPTPRREPLVVIVTATPDPNQPPPVTVIVVTATLPGGAPAPTSVALASTPGVPTFDPALLPTLGGDSPTQPPTAAPTDPSGCPTHVVQQGEVPSVIARRYGVSTADLLKANGLTEETARRIQINQVLVIPINGCGLGPTAEPSNTPTRVVLPTRPPTSTFAPTASDTRLEIVSIIGAGDITSEGIEIRNNSGDVINIEGWTLSDGQGNSFTFPNYQMFNGRRVIVYTREGNNTPFALFWGLPSPVWTTPTATVTISDAQGRVQATALVSQISAAGAVPTPTAQP